MADSAIIPAPAGPKTPPSGEAAVVSLIVFVAVGSLTIAGPVVFYLTGGDRAKTQLGSAKEWLSAHNDAVMTVLFLILGVNLIAKGIRRWPGQAHAAPSSSPVFADHAPIVA